MMEWRTLERFPKANGRWQSLRPPFNRVQNGEQAVLRGLKRWQSFDPLVIATPSSAQFLPPVLVPELAALAHARALAQQRFLLGALLLALGFFIFSAIWSADAGKYTPLIVAAALVTAYHGCDYFLVLKDLTSVQERALYIHWIYQQGVKRSWPILLAMVLAGAAQYALQRYLGGFEPVIRAYGALFSAIADGEWWRHLTGPFFHNGPLHWGLNGVMLFIAASFASAMANRRLLILFIFCATSASIATQFAETGGPIDSVVGLSGGIFGLFGWVAGVAYRARRHYPRHLWLTIVVFTALCIVVSALMLPNASETAHIVGVLLGAVLGWCGICVSAEGKAATRTRLALEGSSQPLMRL